MKQSIGILILIFAIATCTKLQNKGVENKITYLLKNKNYTELNTELNDFRHIICKSVALQADAFLFNSLKKYEVSNKKIDSLVNFFQYNLSDSLMGELLLLKADNYQKLKEHYKAFKTNEIFLKKYAHAFDKVRVSYTQNIQKIYKSQLSDAHHYKLFSKNGSSPFYFHPDFLTNINAKADGNSFAFVLNKKSGTPVIKKSFARELGLVIKNSGFSENNTPLKETPPLYVVIDSLEIGSITISNSIFFVLDDYLLDFPQIKYFSIPTIYHPYRNKRNETYTNTNEALFFPTTPTYYVMANMLLKGVSPKIQLYNKVDSLEFALNYMK